MKPTRRDGVRHCDRGELRKPVRMPNGWLRCEGWLTRTGVFTYLNPDGSERRELRLPSEVFRPQSMASFQMLPVTDEHPPAFLTDRNTSEHQRGMVGENVRRDGDWMAAPLMLTDADLIERVMGGEQQELSGGYLADLLMTPGKVTEDMGLAPEWLGAEFDCVQENIRGNHVAVTERARAGREARIRTDALRMDAAHQTVLSPGREEPPSPTPPAPPAGGSTVKRKIQGIEFDIPDQAAQALDQMEAGHADALKQAQKETADARALVLAEKDATQKEKARADAAAEKLAKAEKAHADAMDPKRMHEAVAKRTELERAAGKLLGQKKLAKLKLDALSDMELKKAVLSELSPDLKLEGRSDAYVDGRWEFAVEQAASKRDRDEDEPAARRVRRAVEGRDEDDDPDGDERADGDEEPEDPERDDADPDDERDDADADPFVKARNKMMRDSRKAHRRPLAASTQKSE